MPRSTSPRIALVALVTAVSVFVAPSAFADPSAASPSTPAAAATTPAGGTAPAESSSAPADPGAVATTSSAGSPTSASASAATTPAERSAAASSASTSSAAPKRPAGAVAAAAAAMPTAQPTSGIPALALTLDDGATLAQVNADRKKDMSWSSSLSLVDPHQASNDVSATGVMLKGHGNSTWTLFQKKAYQIKFDKKTAVLGMPKAKKWILLANDADATFLRNYAAFAAANAMNMPATPEESRFVDLTVNGQYLGLYQLTEKVEIGSGRLDLKNPQGVLVEMDDTYGAGDPIKFLSATSRTVFALKDAVGTINDDNTMDADAAAGWADIKSSLNQLDALLYAPNPDWAAISRIIDVSSFAKFYLLEEYAADSDVSVSSIYFYKDGPSDVLHIGPAWDFDIDFGNCDTLFRGAISDDNYVVNTKWYNPRGNDWFAQLFRNPEFVRAVNTEYDQDGRAAIQAANASIPAEIPVIAQASAANFKAWPSVLGKPSMIPQCGRTVASTAAQENQRLETWVGKRAAFLDSVYGDPGRPILSMRVSTQSVGWHPYATGGVKQGTMGQAKRLEALQLSLLPGADGKAVDGGVQVNADVSGIGWQGWTSATAGTTGQSRAIEALQIKLTGAIAQKYDIRYRAYAQTYGWLPWVSNGQNAGTYGQSKRLEAIEVQIVTKGSVATSPNFTITPNYYLNDAWTGTANIVFAWGADTDQTLVGDWNGDGKDTLALRRGATYAFTNDTVPSASPQFSVVYGNPGDQVLVGDWNGDGKDTLAVRRGNVYYFKNSISGGVADKTIVYGNPDDQVLVGDWNGDGVDTLAVRRGRTYYIRNSISSGVADQVVSYGKPTDTVYVGHFSAASKKDSLAVRRASQYFISYSLHGGQADRTLIYGRPGDTTLVGDWNGDGVDTLGVKR